MKRFLGVLALALGLPTGAAWGTTVQFWVCANGPVDIVVYNVPGEGPGDPTSQAFQVPRNQIWGGWCSSPSGCIFDITYSSEPDGSSLGKVSYKDGYKGRICVPAGTSTIINDGCLCQ